MFDGERIAFVSVDLGIYTSEKLVAVAKRGWDFASRAQLVPSH